jgi:hypothetical protein
MQYLRTSRLGDATKGADVNDHIPNRQAQEIAMSCQPNLTARALSVIQEIKPRHRFPILLAVLGLAVLTSSGASACGRLPAGVEVSGPVLRGVAAPHSSEAQPVIVPHCNFTPPADPGTAASPPERRDNSGASPADRPAALN